MLRQFSDGQIIQQRDTEADGFWLIEEGAVMIGQFLASGEFRAVALLGPGDSYGELAVFSGRPRIVDAVSRGPSRVAFIAGRRLLDALANYPASSRALLSALSAQLQDTLAILASVRRGTNPARLAALLANMAGEDGAVNITQQELADLLGVTRATANAALRDLSRVGLIERGYGSVTVNDRERLASFALG